MLLNIMLLNNMIDIVQRRRNTSLAPLVLLVLEDEAKLQNHSSLVIISMIAS